LAAKVEKFVRFTQHLLPILSFKNIFFENEKGNHPKTGAVALRKCKTKTD
jgi:hypothetical protein